MAEYASREEISKFRNSGIIMDKQFEFLIYQSSEEDVSVNAFVKDETVWLNQKAMAELFGCSTDNVSLHLKNIFSEGELGKL